MGIYTVHKSLMTHIILGVQDHSVQYDTSKPPPSAAASADADHCSVMEQKQTQNGFKDEPCGKPVPEDFAGLCEYVTSFLFPI